jgi:hypothetical protein
MCSSIPKPKLPVAEKFLRGYQRRTRVRLVAQFPRRRSPDTRKGSTARRNPNYHSESPFYSPCSSTHSLPCLHPNVRARPLPSPPYPLLLRRKPSHSPKQNPNPNLNSPLPQFVLLDLQSSLQNLLSLGSSDGNVNGNLLVSPDRERSDSVSCFRGDWGLTGKLFQDFGCSGESITGLSD